MATSLPLKIHRGQILTVTLGMVFIFFLEFLGFFEDINHHLYDLFFRLRGSRDSGNTIVIAAIDEKTLSTLGQWPIKRKYYGQFIEGAGLARIICFDIVFSEPNPDDTVLADAIKNYGNIVLPIYVDGSLRRVEPVTTLSPRGTGHVHVDRDLDNVTRRVFHNLNFNEDPCPSLGSTLYRLYKDLPPSHGPGGPGHKDNTKRLEKFVQEDPMWINYYGPPGTFLHVSFSDVISGQYRREFFKDKIVMVGVTAVGIEAEVFTPFSQKRKGMSGVEVQANILANLLNRDSITASSDILTRLLSLMAAVLSVFIFVRISEKRSALLWIICLLTVMVVAFFLIAFGNIWFPPALLCVALTYAFVAGYIMRLNEAAKRLDQEYSRILSSLRWGSEGEEKPLLKKGFLSLLSSGDLNNRVTTLGRITKQLIFEKNLVDTTLSSYVYGIVLFDSSGRLAIANDRAKKLFPNLERDNINDFDGFIHTLLPHIIDDEKPKSVDHFKKETTEEAISLTVSLTNPDQVFLKMDAGLVVMDSKKYYLFVFSDVTKLKELEARKSEAASMVSHELKQPLQVILGYSQLISMGLPEKKDKYAEKIIQEAERMNKLISAFLGIARLQSGKQALVKTHVDFTRVVAYVVSLIKPVADNKRIMIYTELPSPCSTAYLDRDLLVQCLLNLVENAIKYSPEGREVKLHLHEEKSSFRIDVIDYGYGIDPDKILHIFDKFYRIRTEENKNVAGSGLGLTFVKEATTAMGGTVSVQSEPGKGSVFTLTFMKEGREGETGDNSFR